MVRRREGLRAAAMVVAIVATAAVGNLATVPNLAPWYAGLAKPWFNPPNVVFGPVWTLLYLTMAIAAARVALQPTTGERRRALGLFVAQLGLQAAWSVVFFGLQAPGAALGVVVALVAMLEATRRAFARVDRTAGRLLVPTLLWVSFATVLNGAVWWLNR